MDIRFSPPREGVRGGREQFKWDDVKTYGTKDREHYLGHSVKIGMLKHKNKFYKHDWYMKGSNISSQVESDEVSLVKMYEDELMLEILGAKPKRLMLLPSRPTDVEALRKLLLTEQVDCGRHDDSGNTDETTNNKENRHSRSTLSHYKGQLDVTSKHKRNRSRSGERHRHHRERRRESHFFPKERYRKRERKPRSCSR